MKQRSAWKTVILVFLLAVLCVGAAELAACRFMDRALYEQIVTPVRILYHDARVQVKGISGEYALWLGEEAGLRERLAEAQRLYAGRRQRLRADGASLKAERKRLEAERKRLEEAQLAGDPALDADLMPADPGITQLVTGEDGQEYLLGGNLQVFYYNQGDDPWANAPFGQDPIGRYGCGPTVLAMLVSSLRGTAATPAEVAAWAAQAGYAAPGSGSYLSIVQGAAQHYGFDCAPLSSLTAEALEEALSTGGVLVALMGPGHFTRRGHFILIHGVTLTGGILVADPNSRENSLAVWEAETIIGELSPSRHDGAPLWLITRPLDL